MGSIDERDVSGVIAGTIVLIVGGMSAPYFVQLFQIYIGFVGG